MAVFLTGADCTLQVGSHEVGATEKVWTTIQHVGDVDITGLETANVDIKIRGTDWIPALPTMHNTPTLTFEILATNAETTELLRQAFINRTIYEYRELVGPDGEAGTLSVTIPGFVSKFDQSDKLEDVAKYSVEIKYALCNDTSGNLVVPSFEVTT